MVKKRILKIVTLFVLFSLACAKQKNKVEKIHQTEEKQDNKKNYYIHYNIGLIFDLYLNGIKLDGGKGNAVISNYFNINPFLNNGQNSITLKLLTKDNQNLTKDVLKDITLDIYSAPKENSEDVSLVKKLAFKNTFESLPTLIENWSFEADVLDVNKEFVKNSKKINKEDSLKLLSKVVEYYKKIHNVIDSGDSNKYLELFEKSNNRKTMSVYYNKEEKNKYLNQLTKRVSLSKGNMQPLKDYTLIIHPNQKILSLENIVGNTPLYSKDSVGAIKTFGLMVYINKNNELVVY